MLDFASFSAFNVHAPVINRWLTQTNLGVDVLGLNTGTDMSSNQE